MGIFDSIVSGVMANAGGAGGMQGMLMSMLSGQQAGAVPGMGAGGLAGMMGQFEQAGLGHLMQSWVGNGPNQPVSPDQLQTAFGDDQVQGMAQQAGMEPQDFLSQLAQHLPNVVNAMTPNGHLPTEAT